MRRLGEHRLSRKALLGVLSVCILIFLSGLALLAVGYIKFTSNTSEVPYLWSVTLCQLNTTGERRWVGLELSSAESCPDNLTEASPIYESRRVQQIPIPYDVLVPNVPYSPVIYVTNKVKGSITFSHNYAKDGEVLFSTSERFASMEETLFAYCGGMELVVFRDGPQIETEGDYVTHDCGNPSTGCQYEPGRSLNAYRFDAVKVQLLPDMVDGSYIEIASIMVSADLNSIKMPDVLIHYEVVGWSESQNAGLVLLIIGAIMADLMPAAVYFLLTKTPSPK